MNMDMDLREYLKKNGFDDEKIYVKSAETEILLSILAVDPSTENLRDGLKENFSRILGREINDEDRAFVDECKFMRQSFGLLEIIKNKGIVGRPKFEYLKILWFFSFLGKNYEILTRDTICEACSLIEKYELESDYYSKSPRKSMLTMLCEKYVLKNDSKGIMSLGTKIAKKYLDELIDIYNDVLVTIKKNSSVCKNIDQIYSLERKEYLIEKKFEPIKLVIVHNYDGETKNDSKSKEEKIENTEVKETQKSENDLASSVNKNDDETIKLIKHKELEPKESVIQTFEESLNVLFDLSQTVSEIYKKEGIEDLIKTLNSSAYGNLLDKIFFATVNKEETNKDFLNVSTLIKNALAEYDYVFDFYQKEPLGACIGAPSDDDVEYISKNYRWKGEQILYKNLYVSAPGVLNRKTKKFVYPPLVEVK